MLLLVNSTWLNVLKLLTLMAQNACSYCDKPRWTVTTKASSSASHINLLIQDNGPGLTHEQWDHYLQPFSRNSGHADLDGLGMGLTMAQKLGELLEVNLSHVQVASGLCFRLTLPLGKPKALQY